FTSLLERPDFTTNALRAANREQVTAELRRGFARRSADEWVAVLQEAGVPCDRVQDTAQLLDDPQALAREMFLEVTSQEHPAPIVGVAVPMKNSAYDYPAASTGRRAPALGEHTESVLRDLGMAHAEAGTGAVGEARR